jgi:hypothetical protein
MSHPFERGEEQRKIRKTVSPEKQPQSEDSEPRKAATVRDSKKKKTLGTFFKGDAETIKSLPALPCTNSGTRGEKR